MKPAVFLDRDGTINIEKNYLYQIDEWEWVKGAKESIKKLKDAGYLVIVVTNQAGIARGYYNREDVNLLHEFVQSDLKEYGTYIDAFYLCPHHPEFNKPCQCRKPKDGMIKEALLSNEIDMNKSWIVGDNITDIQAGFAAGLKTILVKTGHGSVYVEEAKINNVIVEPDIYAAVKRILKV